MNKSISSLHLEILDKKRQDLLKKLIPFANNFVLGGGTALALQIAHRLSFDFDFFSQNEIQKTMLENLKQAVDIKNIAVDTSSELTFFTKDDIKITFLHYQFKPRFEIIKLESGLSIFPVEEIALQKAYAIGRRGEYRDYFDLYTILKNGHISFEEIIKGAKRVYRGAFDEKMLLTQLVYFNDISNFQIYPFSKTVMPQPEDVKNYFEKLIITSLEIEKED